MTAPLPGPGLFGVRPAPSATPRPGDVPAPGLPGPDGTVADGTAPAVGEEPAAGGGPTGHPGVDAALAALDAGLDGEPGTQVEAYEGAHRALQQTLATIDQT